MSRKSAGAVGSVQAPKVGSKLAASPKLGKKRSGGPLRLRLARRRFGGSLMTVAGHDTFQGPCPQPSKYFSWGRPQADEMMQEAELSTQLCWIVGMAEPKPILLVLSNSPGSMGEGLCKQISRIKQ